MGRYEFDINGFVDISFMKHIEAIIDLDKMAVYTRYRYNLKNKFIYISLEFGCIQI